MEQDDKKQEVKISELPSSSRVIFSKEINPEEPQENTIYQAARYGNLSAIRKTLEAQGDVNQQDDLGNTALFYSVHTSQKAAALLLIKLGADLNMKNNRGDSPLHEAVFYGHEQMVEFFLKQGADLEIRNCLRLTPLVIAVEEGYENIADILIRAGANINAKLGSSDNSETLLHRAVSKKNLKRKRKIVELLLSNGANVSARAGVFGYTPLYYAKDYADFDVSWLFGNRKDEIVELLQKYGASSERMYRWAKPMHVFRDILRSW